MRMKMSTKRNKDPLSFFLFLIVHLAMVFTMTALLFVICYILVKGVPHLTPSLFAAKYTSENVSLMPALANTIFMTLLSLLFAVPVGVGAAVYLVEYAGRGNRLVRLVGMTAETLSGIPSIVYGLFGALFFVKYLGLGLSLLSGALTLSVMILPLIMRTTEEALRTVPDSYREEALAWGLGNCAPYSGSCSQAQSREFYLASFWALEGLWGVGCADLYRGNRCGNCDKYL